MNKFQRAIYEKFGAFGINANLFDAGKGKNSEKIHQLIDNFCKNKNTYLFFRKARWECLKI